MPFVDESGAPLLRVPLLYPVVDGRGTDRFQLTESIAWIDPRDGARLPIAAHDPDRPADAPGNSTDLASVPWFLWGLLAPYGRQALPALLHDRLSDAVDAGPTAEAMDARRRADDAFRVALLESGVTAVRAAAMWAVVRVQAHWRFARPLGVLLIAQLVLGVAVAVLAVALAATAHPLWLLLLAAPALAALPWGRDAGAVATAAALSALFSPLIAVAAASSAVEFLLALVLWLASGRRGATPRPGPLLAPERTP